MGISDHLTCFLKNLLASQETPVRTGHGSPVHFSRSVEADSLWPHELQHARPPSPSPIPGAFSDSCSSSRWFHPTISFSVIPFSSHLQPLPASGSFPMSQFLSSGDQNIGALASASVLPMKTQDWFPLGWTGWISLQSSGLLQHHSSKAPIIWCSAFFMVPPLHSSMDFGETIALTRWTTVGKVMSVFLKCCLSCS